MGAAAQAASAVRGDEEQSAAPPAGQQAGSAPAAQPPARPNKRPADAMGATTTETGATVDAAAVDAYARARAAPASTEVDPSDMKMAELKAALKSLGRGGDAPGRRC